MGKTAFIKRFATGNFAPSYVKQAGVDFTSKTIKLPDETEVQIHFWDILGTARVLEQNNTLKIYLRNTHGAIVMYDANNPSGKAHVSEWKSMLDILVTLDGAAYKPPVILVANKLDLVCKHSSEYDREELYATRDTLGFSSCYPCSVIANWNVNAVVRSLVHEMLSLQTSGPPIDFSEEISLFEDAAPPPEAKCAVQ